jgi:competence protein ComEC
MDKLPIFTTKKEKIVAFSLLLLIFLINLSWQYKKYLNFTQKPFFYTTAEVIYSHTKSKNGRRYQILKLKTKDDKTVYISTLKHDNFQNSILRLKLYTQSKIKISFWDYLKGFYIYSKILDSKIQKPSIKDKIDSLIHSQHKNSQFGSLFSAIFLATPLQSDIRERMTLFGINHLVALSGFHLGILSGIIFFIMIPIYRFLQRRFFPWRDRNFDLGIVVFCFLFFYIYFVDFPPSLVRSYVMMLFSWVALLFWLKLVSFEFLAIVVTSILAMIPEMIVSLSFWLSVAGVFYIFLILRHIQDKRVLILILPLLIHLLMIPIAHSIFDEVSPYQWLSPILSWIFIIFYPLSLLLHILGLGGVLDFLLDYLWRVPLEFNHKLLPIPLLFTYILFSLLAIRLRLFFWVLVTFALGVGVYLYLF